MEENKKEELDEDHKDHDTPLGLLGYEGDNLMFLLIEKSTLDVKRSFNLSNFNIMQSATVIHSAERIFTAGGSLQDGKKVLFLS